MSERRNREGARSIPAAAGPRKSHSTEASRQLSKERAYQRYRGTTNGGAGTGLWQEELAAPEGRDTLRNELQQEGVKEEKYLL